MVAVVTHWRVVLRLLVVLLGMASQAQAAYVSRTFELPCGGPPLYVEVELVSDTVAHGQDLLGVHRITNLGAARHQLDYQQWLQTVLTDDEVVATWGPAWGALGSGTQVDLAPGQSHEMPLLWDLRDGAGQLVGRGAYMLQVSGPTLGFGGSDPCGPTISIPVTVVPEPTSAVALLFAAVAVLGCRVRM